MPLHNFLLFHLRRDVKNSGFVRHRGFQTPLQPHAFICFLVFGTRDEALALVLAFYLKVFLKRKKFTSQIQTRSFRQGNLFPCLVPVRRFPWPSRSIHLVWYPRRTDETHLLRFNHVTRNALAARNNEA